MMTCTWMSLPEGHSVLIYVLAIRNIRIMRFNNKHKYQSPCVRMTQVEVEGLLCGSIVTDPNVDEAHNIAAEASDSPYAEQSYFEF